MNGYKQASRLPGQDVLRPYRAALSTRRVSPAYCLLYRYRLGAPGIAIRYMVGVGRWVRQGFAAPRQNHVASKATVGIKFSFSKSISYTISTVSLREIQPFSPRIL